MNSILIVRGNFISEYLNFEQFNNLNSQLGNLNASFFLWKRAVFSFNFNGRGDSRCFTIILRLKK